MADYILRVYTDVLTEKATLSSALPGGNRGLYLADGMATVRDFRLVLDRRHDDHRRGQWCAGPPV